jgi:hypothetical protein
MAGARAVAAQFPRLRARLDTAAAAYGAAPEHSLSSAFRLSSTAWKPSSSLTPPRQSRR